MRTVVSVSMSPEMATRLKSSAAEGGQSFSARVCELIKSGLEFERLDTGLFTQTEVRSDDDSYSLEVGEKSGADRDPSDTGSEPESLLPSDHSDVIESSNEDQLDSRRDDFPLGTGPEDGDVGDTRGSPSPTEGEVLETGTVVERIYASVTSEKILVRLVAERAGVSEVEAGEILERLINEDGEPICLARVRGEWVCWIDVG